MHLIKGGMCRNPFAGRTRLDRLDLMDCLEPNAPQEKIIFLQTITDAIHNYLFFGLGRNGTTAEEFAYACEYLFTVRSDQPATWEHARVVKMQFEDENGKRYKKVRLTDSQLRDMCFDTHYEYSGLSYRMDIDRFLSYLKTERLNIIKENQQQVFDFINGMYARSCQLADVGKQLPLMMYDRFRILTEPKSMEEIAALISIPRSYLPDSDRQKVCVET